MRQLGMSRWSSCRGKSVLLKQLLMQYHCINISWQWQMHSSLWLHSSSQHTLAESCCCGAVSCRHAEDFVNAVSEQAGELSVQALQDDALLSLTQTVCRNVCTLCPWSGPTSSTYNKEVPFHRSSGIIAHSSCLCWLCTLAITESAFCFWLVRLL